MSGSQRRDKGADSEDEGLRSVLSVVEQMPVMVVLTNARREIRWVNQAFVTTTGWTLGEVKGRHPRSFLHGPRTQPAAVSRLGRLLAEGQTVNDYEILDYKRSGEPYWVSLNIRPLFDDSGQVVEYLSVQTDITARKQREAEILHGRHRLLQALRLARIGWLEHELANGRVVCSPEVLEYFQIEPSRAGDLQIADLTPYTHPDDVERVKSEYAQAINSGTEYESEHRLVMPSGDVRWGHVRGALEGWEDGSPAIVRLVVQDVTRRKEADRRESERDMREVVARAQTEILERLTANLRQPLQVMLGFAAMLARANRDALSARGRAHLEQIRAAAHELQRVVDDGADLVSLRRGEVVFDPGPVDLHALVVEVASMFDAAAASRQVSLRVAPNPNRAVVIADLLRLQQLLAHLIDHAVRCNHEGGRVELAIEAADQGWVRLAVRADGGSFAPADLPRLFEEPFGRAWKTNEGDEGDEADGAAGLRLAICKALVEGMGGSIQPEGEADAGFGFAVTLPAASQSVVPIGRAAAASGASATQRGKGRVLCVDDDVVSNALVDGLLESRNHLSLSFRRSGSEGIAAAREMRPDLILVDLGLPDMTGFELVKQVRTDPVLRRVPCVALSADSRDETIVAALRAGFRDFLSKPAEPVELLNLIDRLVGE